MKITNKNPNTQIKITTKKRHSTFHNTSFFINTNRGDVRIFYYILSEYRCTYWKKISTLNKVAEWITLIFINSDKRSRVHLNVLGNSNDVLMCVFVQHAFFQPLSVLNDMKLNEE